ncbi:hypothetical protein SAMN05421820_11869 [Pedobacter steynii]|uniref:Uncharacterized protein n=1 Tax=Pedobacter steynii TaxID=430522 RepID=A0A1H0LQ02_9SPHI|nr:hypothetical protein [Pedobacter steynii]NQX43539.1 hypothetical protein [Pedobacter steynii]SDO70205.1 hypothetical protein SAMN05421820_11869 [Pedobacter steynii]
MAQTPTHNTESMKRANEVSIYKLMAVGILISVLGVYLRFAGDSMTLSIVSWAILFVGAFIACKGVFKILAA